MRQPDGICRERTRIGCVSVGWNSGGMSAKRTKLDNSVSADEVMAKIGPGNGVPEVGAVRGDTGCASSAFTGPRP
jgi:hypothetical protein